MALFLCLGLIGCNQHHDPGESSSAPANDPPTTASAPDADPSDKPADGDADKPQPKLAEAVFAGGCFWCVEAVFEELEGVKEAVSGYAGGEEKTANYGAVSRGRTKHAEAVKIIYDPAKITFEKLLAVHFATHDPTTMNRQGADVGPQYRSTIFYASDAEKKATEAMIGRLGESGAFERPIVTTLEPLTKFYEAEPGHQDYVCENPYNSYVRGVALPKVKKVREKFADDLKEKSPLDR